MQTCRESTRSTRIRASVVNNNIAKRIWIANSLHWMISRATANMNRNPGPSWAHLHVWWYGFGMFWLESHHLTGKPGLVLFRHHFNIFQPFPFGCVFGQCLIVVRVQSKTFWILSCISWPWASPLGIVLFFGLAWARHFIEQMDPRPQRSSCTMYLCFSSNIFMAKLRVHERLTDPEPKLH